MPKRALKSNLDALRKELAEAETLDAKTRDMLGEVAVDIEQVLAETASDYESVRERIKAATLEFEAEHPGFARILSEVTDALAKLGI